MKAVYQQFEEKVQASPTASILKRTYINEFHHKNSLRALKEVQIMKQNPYTREQKIAQIELLHQNGASKEASNAERSKK